MAKVTTPTAVTLALSAAALLGYGGLRLLAPRLGEQPPPDIASAEQALADQLPTFALYDLTGEPRSIRSWPGKPLLVNFWATWCAPCLREIPMLKEFQTDNPSLQVVGIAVDRLDSVLAFADQMQFNYPVLVGEADAMAAASAFGVEFFALPFTVFTGADGAVLGVHTGEIHAEHLENFVAVLGGLDAGQIDNGTARMRLSGPM
ncbi:TlpA family protein disulfide reductase [Candidatus Rariloculus sp.]|uniref:TlpA family protein disulfide reductase n=1 Tax=Candidatus Rariloculus sp. TaxID=3101265 RepID=UPI003D11C2BA